MGPGIAGVGCRQLVNLFIINGAMPAKARGNTYRSKRRGFTFTGVQIYIGYSLRVWRSMSIHSPLDEVEDDEERMYRVLQSK